MKLHYMGKYNLNPDSLPHGEHMPNAVAFKEAATSEELSNLAILIALVLLFLFLLPVLFHYGLFNISWIGWVLPFLSLFPHELLHAMCFKEDVYLYTNWKQSMLFVAGTETMSKKRYIFLSLLPNIVFGLVPYIIGFLIPELNFLALSGAFALSMGSGDYYNVFNAITQMPKGARTYLHKFNSYWYIPE